MLKSRVLGKEMLAPPLLSSSRAPSPVVLVMVFPPVPSAPLLVMRKFPALIVTAPVKALLPARVRTPVPALMRPPPVPLSTPSN